MQMQLRAQRVFEKQASFNEFNVFHMFTGTCLQRHPELSVFFEARPVGSSASACDTVPVCILRMAYNAVIQSFTEAGDNASL